MPTLFFDIIDYDNQQQSEIPDYIGLASILFLNLRCVTYKKYTFQYLSYSTHY